jgi:hypothetical protein
MGRFVPLALTIVFVQQVVAVAAPPSAESYLYTGKLADGKRVDGPDRRIAE